jgi:hypothetical protein
VSARRVQDWDVNVPVGPAGAGTTVHISNKTRGQAVAEVVRRANEAGYRVVFTDARPRACPGSIFCRDFRRTVKLL